MAGWIHQTVNDACCFAGENLVSEPAQQGEEDDEAAPARGSFGRWQQYSSRGGGQWRRERQRGRYWTRRVTQCARRCQCWCCFVVTWLLEHSPGGASVTSTRWTGAPAVPPNTGRRGESSASWRSRRRRRRAHQEATTSAAATDSHAPLLTARARPRPSLGAAEEWRWQHAVIPRQSHLSAPSPSSALPPHHTWRHDHGVTHPRLAGPRHRRHAASRTTASARAAAAASARVQPAVAVPQLSNVHDGHDDIYLPSPGRLVRGRNDAADAPDARPSPLHSAVVNVDRRVTL